MIARDLAALVPCAYCGAGIEQPCRTSSGARSTDPHAARVDPMYAAWRKGFEEGQQDILEALDSGNDRYIKMARRRRPGGAQ